MPSGGCLFREISFLAKNQNLFLDSIGGIIDYLKNSLHLLFHNSTKKILNYGTMCIIMSKLMCCIISVFCGGSSDIKIERRLYFEQIIDSDPDKRSGGY